VQGPSLELLRDLGFFLLRAFLALVYLIGSIRILTERITIGEKLVILSAWLLSPVLIYGFVVSDLAMINTSCATIAGIGLLQSLRG
jgi:hypothetical protein